MKSYKEDIIPLGQTFRGKHLLREQKNVPANLLPIIFSIIHRSCCSFLLLLLGQWLRKSSNAASGMEAYWVTLGDLQSLNSTYLIRFSWGKMGGRNASWLLEPLVKRQSRNLVTSSSPSSLSSQQMRFDIAIVSFRGT